MITLLFHQTVFQMFLIEDKPNLFEERWKEVKLALMQGRDITKNKKFIEVILVGSARRDKIPECAENLPKNN